MNQICKYCKIEFNFEKNQQFITHVASCKSNPNFKDKYKKSSLTFLNKRKNYNFNCVKCGKQYSLNLTDHNYENKKYTKHCSRKCANTREQTKETKEKITNGLNNFNIKNGKNRKIEEKECPCCGEKFFTKRKNTFCSNECSIKTNFGKSYILTDDQKLKISKTRKEKFKNGVLKITGGTTSWYSIETSNGLIRVQGTYEVAVCKILDILKLKNEIKDWEYTSDRFEYVNIENKNSSYLIDFKIFENNNSFYYLEIKGYKKENDELKWKSVRDKGINLKVWYKNDIENLAKYCNIKIDNKRNGSIKILN